jgi:hypothetical protein
LVSNFSRSTTTQQEALKIAQLADSEINFDPAEIQDLYTAVESGDKQTIKRAVLQAQQKAAVMLDDRHQDFGKYLQQTLKDKC